MAVSVPAELIGAVGCAGLLGRRLQDVLVLGADWMPRGVLAEAVATISAPPRGGGGKLGSWPR